MSYDVIVLAGPTAVGKGTVSAYLRENFPQVWLSVSATTRQPRPGEEHGKHYYFVSQDEFDDLVAKDQMLEWALVHGLNETELADRLTRTVHEKLEK